MIGQNPRRRFVRRAASIVGIGAIALPAIIGAPPARAAGFGDTLPNYDPGVHGTINQPWANCGIVLFENVDFQGKKLCGPLTTSITTPQTPLDASNASLLGGDMDWRKKVSSIQVRPGLQVEMWGYTYGRGYHRRTFYDDTPNLGDFDNAVDAVRVVPISFSTTLINAAAGRPVTTKNAVSCTADQGPEKAVDRSVASIYTNKWCAQAMIAPLDPMRYPPTLEVDLGAVKLIKGVVLHHAGDGPLGALLGLNLLKTQREPDAYNTYMYTIRTSMYPDGPWNTWSFTNPYFADVTNHGLVEPATGGLLPARYVRLEVTRPTFFGPYVVRLQEFEVMTS